MTAIFALNRSTSLAQPAGGAAPVLETGMSFEDALRAAEQSSNRMFGFDELGLFGRGAATCAPDCPPYLAAGGRRTADAWPDVRDNPQAGAPLAEGEAGVAAVKRQAQQRGTTVDTLADGRVPPLSEPITQRTGGAGYPLAIEPEQVADEPATRLAAPVRHPSVPTGKASARLALMIDGGRVLLVARDFALGEDDRARIAERAAEILEAFDLGLGGLTLNGIRDAVVPFAREDG